jgi:hypothetical protein
LALTGYVSSSALQEKLFNILISRPIGLRLCA